MNPIDTHTHTDCSVDGHCSLDALCGAAKQKGVRVLAVTEHYDFDTRGGRDYYMAHAARRYTEFARAREAALETLLLYGIEIGQPHLAPAETKAFIDANRFDMVIGSLHDLRPERDIYHIAYTDAAVCRAVLDDYYAEMLELLAQPQFDTLGHLDYALRVMGTCFPSADLTPWRDAIDALLRRLVATGVALELNTAACRRWMGSLQHLRWVFERYRALGGERVTTGSDAHRTDDLAAHMDEAYDLLRAAGFRYVTYYEQRTPHCVPLP
ncbi:MAG: PHP domain-containing protein [Clostridia bacterium]|nr:PHP domain-containing protein [Clostridia bacterium]